MTERDDLSTVTFAESQAWVKASLSRIFERDEFYADEFSHDILGESERGTIMAPKPGTDDWWEPFDMTKPEHRAALDESLRRGVIGFLDLEYGDDR
jgi:hypothetical protein